MRIVLESRDHPLPTADGVLNQWVAWIESEGKPVTQQFGPYDDAITAVTRMLSQVASHNR